MPKKGKDRRSARDDARDLAGGLGGDEDYDWIKSLGEGRSSASARSAPSPGSAASSGSAASIGSAVTSVAAAPPVVRPVAARPATLPARRHRDPGPERDRQPDRDVVRPERSALRPERSAPRPERSEPRPERSRPWTRTPPPWRVAGAYRPAGARRPAGTTGTVGRVVRHRPGPLPVADRQPRLTPATRTTTPRDRPSASTAGRAVDLVSGQGSDLAFNPGGRRLLASRCTREAVHRAGVPGARVPGVRVPGASCIPARVSRAERAAPPGARPRVGPARVGPA
jgi:hypothetical protein